MKAPDIHYTHKKATKGVGWVVLLFVIDYLIVQDYVITMGGSWPINASWASYVFGIFDRFDLLGIAKVIAGIIGLGVPIYLAYFRKRGSDAKSK